VSALIKAPAVEEKKKSALECVSVNDRFASSMIDGQNQCTVLMYMPVCVCMCIFACLCVCRWRSESWGEGVGRGVLTVNTPWGKPIKNWVRRGFKSQDQPQENKKEPPNHHSEVNTSESAWVYMRVIPCLENFNMPTSPLLPPGSANTVSYQLDRALQVSFKLWALEPFKHDLVNSPDLLIPFWVKVKLNFFL